MLSKMKPYMQKARFKDVLQTNIHWIAVQNPSHQNDSDPCSMLLLAGFNQVNIYAFVIISFIKEYYQYIDIQECYVKNAHEANILWSDRMNWFSPQFLPN